MKNISCPRCNSENIIRNGNTDYGKPRYRCKECGRHFVINPAKGKISDEKRDLVDKLLLEKISLAGIARAVGVSESWLQKYINGKYKNLKKEIKVTPKKKFV